MGMATHIWGPSIHHALHTISFNYPINPTQQQKEDYYNFVHYLGKVLPCGVCRNNLPRNLKAANWDWDKLKNRETFSKFIYNLHQKINLSTGKKLYPKSYEEVRDIYESFRSKKPLKQKGGKKEVGCSEPVRNAVKSKCILKILPRTSKLKGIQINNKCLCKKK